MIGRRSLRMLTLVSGLLATACMTLFGPTEVSGPPPLRAEDVREVRVLDLARPDAPPRVITDPEAVRSLARFGVFSEGGWWKAREGDFQPEHRIEFVLHDGSFVRYWYGMGPSGACLRASDAAGALDPTRHKELTSAVYSQLTNAFGIR